MKKVVNVEDLFLAEVRRFDVEMNASEIPLVRGYTFLERDGDSYRNLFCPSLDYPVYVRTPYTNTTRDGEDYGSKIILAQGDVEDGLCFIIQSSLSKMINQDKITTSELKKYVLQSDKFFLDCAMLFDNHQISFLDCFINKSKLMRDISLKNELYPDYGKGKNEISINNK